MKTLVDKLESEGVLSEDEFVRLIEGRCEEDERYAACKARKTADGIYGKDIYIRGLIEFTSICRNDCYYCGLRRSNIHADRYRLGMEDILSCCRKGYALGFRTFVLQGGEDPYYTDEIITGIIGAVKEEFPDCAVTLSIGEKSRESYEKYYNAGADRYLLRHETADVRHYGMLHPDNMSLGNRMECLRQLKDIGYQCGCGFMVGSPYQTAKTLAEDFAFIHGLKPAMVGIGPFVPHRETKFANEPHGTLRQTLFLLSLIRIMEKDVLLPATTALATIHPRGRELGIMAGANVIMPNLSPGDVRDKYSLYDKKACTGEEAAENIADLKRSIGEIGYSIVTARGDVIRT